MYEKFEPAVDKEMMNTFDATRSFIWEEVKSRSEWIEFVRDNPQFEDGVVEVGQAAC